ncbi:MAG: hypothetical protein N2383_10205 [Caldilineales bacterium]|nr:hypothetical protein [Caldilineales bacterium]
MGSHSSRAATLARAAATASRRGQPAGNCTAIQPKAIATVTKQMGKMMACALQPLRSLALRVNCSNGSVGSGRRRK